MNKHYISVLGTGNYHECTYALIDANDVGKQIDNSKIRKTKYVQSAMFELICKDFDKDDRVTIFVTPESKSKHWESLKEELDKINSDLNINCVIKPVDIREALSDEQQWENFNIMYDWINEGEELIVDVTHGFRILPMQIFSILSYAETLKNIVVRCVYYGMFEQPFGCLDGKYISYEELDKKYRIDRNRYSIEVHNPLIDYKNYLTISKLSSAAHSFKNTGDAKLLKKISTESKVKRFKEKDNQRYQSEKVIFEKINKLCESLDDISDTIRCARGSYQGEKERSVQKAVNMYNSLKNEGITDVLNETEAIKNEAKAIKNIVNYIEKFVDKYFENVGDDADDLETGFSIVKWCISFDIIQTGFTALRETIISWIYSLCDKAELKEQYSLYLRYKKSKKKNSDTDTENDLVSEDDIKDTDFNERDLREFVNWGFGIKNSNPDGIIKEEREIPFYEYFANVAGKDKWDSICNVAKKIRESRNDINHFGFSSTVSKTNNLKKHLKEYYDELLELYNS
ncbi:MAG: CRISPR-associated DxTHG motif protein [Oscillospiraceae bacterium]|nr:CRISPR-associated DxTHG motif protein [Oscillospiraceae bacterium]